MRGFFSGRLQPSTVAKENTGGLKTPATSIVIFTVNAMNPPRLYGNRIQRNRPIGLPLTQPYNLSRGFTADLREVDV